VAIRVRVSGKEIIMSEEKVGMGGEWDGVRKLESAWRYEGPIMTSWQYEALCRHVIAEEYGISAREIQTGNVKGSSRKGQRLRHQIDLFWTSRDEMCEYQVFANAKWRKRKVQKESLMALIGVWRDIGAHKAMMITNTGYSSGVVRQAKEKGISLVVVRPVFDFSGLSMGSATEVLGELDQVARFAVAPIYQMGVIHRGLVMERQGDKEKGTRLGDAETRGRGDGLGHSNDEVRNANDEGEGGGMWLVGGVEDKAMGSGEIPNKMMRGR
jgi:hypothetical protein